MEQKTSASSKEIRKEIHTIILNWWNQIKSSNNRGARAQLRRCREPGDVLLYSTYYDLSKMVEPVWPHSQTIALAAISGLLSHVETQETKLSFPEQLGSSKTEGGKPPLSENRFRELIKCRDWAEYYFRMRRAILMLNKKANPISIIDLTLQFGFEMNQAPIDKPSQSFQFKMASDYFKSSLKKAKS